MPGAVPHGGREVVPAMPFFYYKAYDAAGQKKTGVIEALHRRAADAELRRTGLRPYFLHDYQQLKKILRHKQKKRERVIAIVIVGAVAVVSSAVLSGVAVRYAGRERAPKIEEYKQTGLVTGSAGVIVAKTREEREFALDIHKVWQTFCPGAVKGLEVRKLLMTVYVTRDIRRMSEKDLEVLASQTVRALQRRFGTSGCTLLVVEGDVTILDVSYNTITKTTRVKSYR